MKYMSVRRLMNVNRKNECDEIYVESERNKL